MSCSGGPALKCAVFGISSFLLFSFASAAASISIDANKQYQTIEGFGAHGAADVWWSSGPFFSDKWLSLVVDTLGLTITRNEYYPGAFDYDKAQFAKQVKFFKALKAKALQAGEPIKFIATYWSPPAAFKDNATTVNGGALLPETYPDFANYAIATAQNYKDSGIDLYALSLQNEPMFVEPYNSCVYTSTQYRDMIKAVGPTLKANFPNLKLFGPETMLESGNGYIYSTLNDSTAKKYLDIVAYHGYSNGVNPTPSSMMATLWRNAYKLDSARGKTTWMTETSGYFENWDDAMKLAEAMYAGLKYGKMSGWVFWQLGGGSVLNEFNLMTSSYGGIRFYTSKHFFRYIRPGATMIECTEVGDSTVHAVAFNDKVKKTLAIVLINSGTTAKDVTISGTQLPPAFVQYVSTATDYHCTNKGNIASSAAISMPAKSIISLYGSNYNPVVGVINSQVEQKIHDSDFLKGKGSVAIYNLGGKEMFKYEGKDIRATVSSLRSLSKLAKGTYCLVVKSATGSHRVPFVKQ